MIGKDSQTHVLLLNKGNEFDWLLQIGELIHDQTIYILTEFDATFFYVNDGRGEGVRQDEKLGAFGH